MVIPVAAVEEESTHSLLQRCPEGVDSLKVGYKNVRKKSVAVCVAAQ